MNEKHNVITDIYSLRHKFAIIGLTGRTGSGCSTVAELVTKSGFSGLLAPEPVKNPDGVTNDERKYRILYTYLNNVWKSNNISFVHIRARDFIFFFVLIDGFDSFLEAFRETQSTKAVEKDSPEYESLKQILEEYKNEFQKLQLKAIEVKRYIDENNYKDQSNNDKSRVLFFEEIPDFVSRISNKIKTNSKKKLYKQYQLWGNNIRKYGTARSNSTSVTSPVLLARTINAVIKIRREQLDKKGAFFVIDSLRNPYEVLYFRERYSAFYLMSINTDEQSRRHNLEEANYAKEDIDKLDGEEHPEKRKGITESYYTQDVQACIEMSDIHIVHHNENVDLNFSLKRQLVHFIALMMHPGLVPPSPEERMMQIAYTAKLNSGCISRQVGAAVTDKNYSVKAIGWNTVAQGQTPCSLRDFRDLCSVCDKSAFSPFELSDKDFRSVVNDLKTRYDNMEKNLTSEYGLSHPFCFKDLYTVQKQGQKNQVHTRSLHAEENAFLQLAKYGSEGIEGGKLFTTASCCELCAKKAYQLGIKDIYYIDTYPGISLKHIFTAGTNIPNIHLFQGAIGRTYLQLYTPFLPLKDEIELLTGVEVKYESVKDTEKKEEPKNNKEVDDMPHNSKAESESKQSWIRKALKHLFRK